MQTGTIFIFLSSSNRLEGLVYISVFKQMFGRCDIKKNFSGSNNDGSFTTAISNSFLVS